MVQASWTRKARLVQAAVGAGPDTAGGETPPLPHTMGCLGGRMISAPIFKPLYFLRAGEVDSPYQGEMAEGQKG